MAETRETVTVPMDLEEVFDYLADFSNTEEWDPGVETATRLDEGPVDTGSRFRVSVGVGPAKLPVEYWITTYERPNRVVLAASGSGFRGRDDIRLRQVEDGTEVDWTVEFGFRPPLSVFDPVLQPGLAATGRKAIEGLRSTIEAKRSSRP